MVKLPASLKIKRSRKSERVLVSRARKWIEAGERTPGLHASDLMDPRQAYWQRKDPKPLPDRLVTMFLIGKVLHAFVLAAVDGKKGVLLSQTDDGTRVSKELGISYSPDKIIKGIPRELKTSRSFYEPKGLKDLELYVEQLLIYMVGENVCEGELWILFLNHRDKGGATSPTFRAYKVTISKEDLVKCRRELQASAYELNKALDEGKPERLTLCRKFKCGKKNCQWWEKCKPEGRYGRPTTKWAA